MQREAPDVVLFGAGIGVPAALPMAVELIAGIAAVFVEDGEWAKKLVDASQPTGPLRFETAMEWLTETADPKLDVLSFLDDAQPGPLHEAMAWGASRGMRLVTVNFDDLVERLLPRYGLSAMAIDAHHPPPATGGGEKTRLLKLHGTRLLHNESGPQPSPSPLHATISTIVRGGGGSGLPEVAHNLLSTAVDGSRLLVVGYSGSDDVDVMPSLERCRPASVTWVQHAGQEPREAALDNRATPGTERLLQAWQSNGVEVRTILGDTAAYLRTQGWKVPPPLSPEEQQSRRNKWRSRLACWAEEVKAEDPSGLGWVSVSMGATSRYRDAQLAAEQSAPSLKSDGLWSQQRRLYELAQGAYHDPNSSGEEVLELAATARNKAIENGDPGYAAHAEIMAARQRIESRELEQASAALKRALAHLDGSGGKHSYGRAYQAEWKARLHIFEDDADSALDEARRSAELYAANGYWVESCEALQVAGQAAWIQDDLEAAVEQLERAIDIARKGPYFDQLVAALDRRAHVAYQKGDVEASRAYAKESSEVALEHGLETEIEQQLSAWGTATNELGLFEEALAAFQQARRYCDPQDTTWRPDIAVGLADTLLHLGKPDQALAVLEEEKETIDRDPWDIAQAEAIRLRAGACTVERFDAAVARAQEMDRPPYARQLLSIVRLRTGGAAAQELVDQAEGELRSLQQDDRLKRLRSWLQDHGQPAAGSA